MTDDRRDRRGFTIVEMLVVALLGSLLLGAIYQVLVTNQRTYTAQAEQVRTTDLTRTGLALLTAELREVSANDFTAISAGQLSFRIMRRFGLVCDVDLNDPPVLTVRKVEAWIEDGDSIFVFAENDPNVTRDDTWIRASVTSADTTETCGGVAAADLTFSGQQTKFLADTVRAGAPIRSWEQIQYKTVSGGYLTRYDYDSADEATLLGPFDVMRFEYFDEDGNTTSSAADVHEIHLTLVASSDATTSLGNQIGDSVTVRVFPRN